MIMIMKMILTCLVQFTWSNNSNYSNMYNDDNNNN